MRFGARAIPGQFLSIPACRPVIMFLTLALLDLGSAASLRPALCHLSFTRRLTWHGDHGESHFTVGTNLGE